MDPKQVNLIQIAMLFIAGAVLASRFGWEVGYAAFMISVVIRRSNIREN